METFAAAKRQFRLHLRPDEVLIEGDWSALTAPPRSEEMQAALALRAWFARETGWALHIERDCARLYKRPADLRDASRGLAGGDRRRYVLLSLACAVLERADPQITLRLLGERLLTWAADPALASRGFRFELQAQHERRELVAVCRTLLDLGVLQRVVGDEDGALTDVAMPAEGTQAHATLLVAGFLAKRAAPADVREVAAFLADARERYGSYWRKSARESGAEHELAQGALERLQRLQLIARDGDTLRPLPALARFAVGDADIRPPTPRRQDSLFDTA